MSNQVNIKDLWKLAKDENKPLLGNTTGLQYFNYMTEYVNNFAKFDRNFCVNYLFFYPNWNINMEESAGDVLDQFRADVVDMLYKNNLKYSKMWELTQLDYDPIQNYDRTEVTTFTPTGTESTNESLGSRTDNESIGSRTDNESIGSREDIVTRGDTSTTDTKSVAPFDTTEFQNSEKNTSISVSVTDSNEIGAQTNSNTIGAQSNSTTVGAQSNSYDKTFNNRIDTTNSHIFGNIGVTTSQQMITSSIDLYAVLNFYDILFKDIITTLCHYSDSGIDVI